MNFKPCNRHLLIEPTIEEPSKDTASILVPEEYRPSPAFITAKVLAQASDCKLISTLHPDTRVVCNNSMVEEVKIGEETYYLLLENYVMGLIILEE